MSVVVVQVLGCSMYTLSCPGWEDHETDVWTIDWVQCIVV